MPNYKTPGVYIEEVSKFLPSIGPLETAIPVFIGYTEKAKLKKKDDLRNTPRRITSLLEYDRFFGNAYPEKGITVEVNTKMSPIGIVAKISNPSNYLMYYSLDSFYANGGGPCYIVSVGDYSGNGLINKMDLEKGLEEAGKIDEITLNVFPDGVNISPISEYYSVVNQSLEQCKNLKDRFTICDVCIQNDPAIDDVDSFRNSLVNSTDDLKYGAAYFPYLEMNIDYRYYAKDVKINKDGSTITLDGFTEKNITLYELIKDSIAKIPIIMPPSSSVAGIYSRVDRERGVWKAPANVNINNAIKPIVRIGDREQERLNVDVVAGKSINAIRSFAGRGAAIIWGARTLAGNDNEWRYVPVRRFIIMVEESIKVATAQFVFEPNDVNTWTRIKGMLENYLTQIWRNGALAGSTPEQAFFVKVGFGKTMTPRDILNGNLIIEIGMAVVRPAEFIILRFQHKMQES